MDESLTHELAGQGYALVRGLLDSTWVSRLKQEERRFANDKRSLSVQVQLVHRSALIREFVTSGPAVRLAIEVLGPNVCFTHQQYVTKHPDGGARTDIPWHQDNGFGRLEPPDDLTVWIALDDCDEGNGCLWVMPGSQRQGLLPHQPVHGLMAVDVAGQGVPLPMQAGDAVLFGSLMLHRSGGNCTETARAAMYVRYCSPLVVMVNQGNRPVLDDAYSWMVAGEA